MTTTNRGFIGRQDLKKWAGTSAKTFSRRTSTGGSQTLYLVGHEVDCLGLYAAAITDMNDITIGMAISGAGGTNCQIILDHGNWAIDNNLTIPSNVILRIPFGAYLTVASGKTLTLAKPPIAGPYQIFYGSGTATVTGYPQDQAWWGNIQRNDFTQIRLTEGGLFCILDENAQIIHEFPVDLIPSFSEVTNFCKDVPSILNYMDNDEIKDVYASYYDFNDCLIHQISSNEIMSLNETFNFS